MNRHFWTGWNEVPIFAWLADVSLQVAIILGLILLVVRFGGAWLSASKKHTLLAAALLSIPVLMVASLWAPGWGLSSHSPGATGDTIRASSSDIGSSAVLPVETGTIAETQSIDGTTTSAEKVNSSRWFILVGWLGGVLVFVLLALTSAWRLRQLRLPATPIREGRRAEMIEELRSEFGISEQRNFSLLESATNSMPMTWGWRNAVILLPAESSDWDGDRLRLVLRHEMAHVVRADSAVSLAAFFCASLLWFHPLAWLACRRLWQLREQACDDHVLTVCDTDPESYAEQLLAVVRSLGTTRPPLRVPVVAMAMAMSQSSSRNLRVRVHSVLAEDRHRDGFGDKARRIVLPFWLIAVVALAGLSACRDTGKPEAEAEAEADLPNGWERRIFVLTNEQWQRLSGGQDLFRTKVVDPFADPQVQPQPPTSEILRSAALAVRSRLIKEGVKFEFRQPGDAELAVSMGDSRTLIVCGDEALLDQVAEILASYSDSPQIRIRAHVFRVPTDFEFQKEISQVDGSGASGSVTGIVDADTAAALMARAEKAEGAEVIARPVVVTGSSIPATLEVGREFIYPTEYDPPEIPNEITGDPNQGGSFPVTPANPTAFETRTIGLIMQFLPELRRDGTIQLELNLTQQNFEGFINYGSPINAAMTNETSGDSAPIVLSENRILMPVFTKSEYESEFISEPDSWIVVGGMGATTSSMASEIYAVPGTGESTQVNSEKPVKGILLFIIKADLIK